MEGQDASLLQLELEAMTWASQAKDAAIASLERKLQAQQEEFAALASRSARLEKALATSRAREEALWQKIAHMNAEQRKLEEAEEHLSIQLGQLEAEYLDMSRRHKREIETLRRSDQGSDCQDSEILKQKQQEIDSLHKSLNHTRSELDQLKRKQQQQQQQKGFVAAGGMNFVLSASPGLDKILVWNTSNSSSSGSSSSSSKPVESLA